MRLYLITTHFFGKDLDKSANLGYIVAPNADAVFDFIDTKHRYGSWAECVGLTREEIIATKGDMDTELMGEFYDQKFGWDDLGEVSDEDVAHLKRLKIIT